MQGLGQLLQLHISAFAAGFVLDLLAGDPYWLPHPVRLMGKGIGFLERCWNQESFSDEKRLRRGRWMALVVPFFTAAIAGALLFTAYSVHAVAGMLVETVMTYQMLAAKCLKKESMKVYEKLRKEDLEGARQAVSMIVGRDTKNLDASAITRAAVETVAENTSDGEIAPMLALAFGGPVLGFAYKAVNTMDSMVGYKNERYLYFGRAAARLDDVVNFLPSRISALLMIVFSGLMGCLTGARTRMGCLTGAGTRMGCLTGTRKRLVSSDGSNVDMVEGSNTSIYSGLRAYQIWKRDRRKHASPNSAQTESACAGALGIQLAGNARYFGKLVRKPWIGDPERPVEPEDIRRANRLMLGTSWLCFMLCAGIQLWLISWMD